MHDESVAAAEGLYLNYMVNDQRAKTKPKSVRQITSALRLHGGHAAIVHNIHALPNKRSSSVDSARSGSFAVISRDWLLQYAYTVFRQS